MGLHAQLRVSLTLKSEKIIGSIFLRMRVTIPGTRGSKIGRADLKMGEANPKDNKSTKLYPNLFKLNCHLLT
jgi:hypothetical protein